MIAAALFAICSRTGAGPAVKSNLWFLHFVRFFAAVGTDNAANCQLQMYVPWVKTWKKDFLWKHHCLLFPVLVSGNSWLDESFKMVDNWIGKAAKSLWKLFLCILLNAVSPNTNTSRADWQYCCVYPHTHCALFDLRGSTRKLTATSFPHCKSYCCDL